MSVEANEKKRNILLAIIALALVAAGVIWYLQTSAGPAGDSNVRAADEHLKKIQESTSEETKKLNEAPPEIDRSRPKGAIPAK